MQRYVSHYQQENPKSPSLHPCSLLAAPVLPSVQWVVFCFKNLRAASRVQLCIWCYRIPRTKLCFQLKFSVQRSTFRVRCFVKVWFGFKSPACFHSCCSQLSFTALGHAKWHAEIGHWGGAELTATVFCMFLPVEARLGLNLRKKQNRNLLEKRVPPSGTWICQALLF